MTPFKEEKLAQYLAEPKRLFQALIYLRNEQLFNSYDTEFGTSLANQAEKKQQLTAKQLHYGRKLCLKTYVSPLIAFLDKSDPNWEAKAQATQPTPAPHDLILKWKISYPPENNYASQACIVCGHTSVYGVCKSCVTKAEPVTHYPEGMVYRIVLDGPEEKWVAAGEHSVKLTTPPLEIPPPPSVPISYWADAEAKIIANFGKPKLNTMLAKLKAQQDALKAKQVFGLDFAAGVKPGTGAKPTAEFGTEAPPPPPPPPPKEEKKPTSFASSDPDLDKAGF